MLSVSCSSIAAIFSRFSTRYSASALLLTLVSGSVLLSGCSSDAEPASDQTIQAISILGSESGIMGAMHAFDGIEAFVDAVDRESSLQAREMLNDVLRRMDLNPEDAAIDAYFSFDPSPFAETISAVVFAPVTEELLEKASNGSAIIDRANADGHGHTIAYQDGGREVSDNGIYASLIEDGLLLVATSRDRLDQMHARAHGVNPETGEFQPAVLSNLVQLASHNQVWVATESAQQFLKRFPLERFGREAQLLSGAISGVAVAFDLGATRDGSTEITGTALLSPKDGIDVDDIVDLVEGLVALGKIQMEDQEHFKTILDRIDVSEFAGVARIAFRVSTSDIRSVQRRLSE